MGGGPKGRWSDKSIPRDPRYYKGPSGKGKKDGKGYAYSDSSYNPHAYYYGPDGYYDDWWYGYGSGKGKGKYWAPGHIDESESAEEDQDTKVERARKRLAKIDPEYAADIKEKRAKEDEKTLRSHGEALASSLKATFESEIQKITSAKIAELEKKKEQEAPSEEAPSRGRPKRASTADGASAAPGKLVLSRAEMGWLQSVVGSYDDVPENKTLKEMTEFVESALSSRVVMSQVNKLIASSDLDPATNTKREKAVAVMKLIRGIAS